MRLEIKRSITNKYFICICVFGIIIAFLHSYNKIEEYNSIVKNLSDFAENGQNPYSPITNAFTMWIGWDSDNMYAKLFYYLFPILSILPYCWSYCSDYKQGYAKKVIDKYGNYNYHLSKYIAVFISSGLIMVIPMVLNLLIILLFVPAITPDSVYDIYYGIFSNNFMADFFYSHPFVYVSLFILLGFIFSGLFGCIGYSISTIVKSKIVSIITPISIILLAEYIKNQVISDTVVERNNFSPLSFLCPAKSLNTNWFIIIFEIVLLFLITFSLSCIRFRDKTAIDLKMSRCFYEK